jgi:hypothetical protein
MSKLPWYLWNLDFMPVEAFTVPVDAPPEKVSDFKSISSYSWVNNAGSVSLEIPCKRLKSSVGRTNSSQASPPIWVSLVCHSNFSLTKDLYAWTKMHLIAIVSIGPL